MGKNMRFFVRLFAALLVVSFGLVSAQPAAALDSVVSNYKFKTPVFGLAVNPDNSLLVADAGQGIVELRKGKGELLANLPNVTDIAPIGRGVMYAVTGGGTEKGDAKLYKVAMGKTKVMADLAAFEAKVNPHPANVDSNPFDVALVNGGAALVADAGGNDLLVVDAAGRVDWVAVLPDQMVPTAHLKSLVCPTNIAELSFVCDLPAEIPAEAVATSVAVGPDGAYYVGELKGFPFPTGYSRIWRVDPGARHVRCGSDAGCTQVASGFTAIIDLAFAPNGTLYVTELDEAGAGAIELSSFGINVLQGGTVNACNITNWKCTQALTGLMAPMATAVDKKGQVYVLIEALLPTANIIKLP